MAATRGLGGTALRAAALVSAALVSATFIGGCASSRPKPEPLESLEPRIAAPAAWTGRIEGVAFPLTVGVSDGAFTVAGSDGTVVAFDAESGRERWRTTVGAALSAGVGTDGRMAAVATRNNELVVLEQGRVLWRKALGTRTTTAPLVAGERVFVLGIDRSVQAFDALDGRKLWSLQRPGDALTLAQAGVLGAFKDVLIVGQGPRLTGVDPLRGTVRWEVPIGTPRGANEIERLADLVGPAARVGNQLCVRAFQAAVGCADAERGTLSWSKNIGGLDAVAADVRFVFAADASDRITAWSFTTGEVAWTTEKLRYRGLSAPLSIRNWVVFGDADGVLHWFDRDTGTAQLRTPTDGSGVVAPPVAVGATVLVVTRKGGLHAFRAP